MLLAGTTVVGTVLLLSWPGLERAIHPMLVEWVVAGMTDEERGRFLQTATTEVDVFREDLIAMTLAEMPEAEREAVYQRLANSAGSWQDVLSEPDVGRIAKKNHTFNFKGVEVVTNNAGLWSSRDYTSKPDDVFRIVCLGDSMVAGTGGLLTDRFCDQIEHFYRDHHVLGDGKNIEAIAVGIDSWTTVNEATYLASRISDYDPDVILVLTVANDITDTFGVNGAGTATQEFSPEYRSLGTAVFSIWPTGYFGVDTGSALMTDLAPEANRRWEKSMGLLKRLEDLQHRRGKHAVFAVLDFNPYFSAIYADWFDRLQFTSPRMFTSFMPGPSTQLAHDPHPNRAGHWIMATHFIHVMSSNDMVPVAPDQLPPLHARLTAEPVERGEGRLQALRAQYARDHLRTRVDFDNLAPTDLQMYLGGFFPERRRGALTSSPFASLKSAFLLAHPGGQPEVTVRIRVPDKVALYPFDLDLFLQGTHARTLHLENASDAGVHELTAALPPGDPLAIEVMLQTSSYWTTIDDQRMKSFYLLSAEARAQ